jgi:hypothetical protein
LRREAPQLAYWVLICPSASGDSYIFVLFAKKAKIVYKKQGKIRYL